MSTVVYPFDPTGSNPANRITNEQQVLNTVNGRDHHFIVPDLAPFFTDGLVFEFRTPDGTLVPLTEGVDYYFTHHFLSASRACAKPIYGSIEFLNKALNGVVTLVAYQTVGGIWTADEAEIAEILANKLRNPRTTSWEQVVEQPVMFPVIDHEWNLVDMVGASALVAALDGIRDAVLTSIQNNIQHLKVSGGYVSGLNGGRVALGGDAISSGNQFGGLIETSSPADSASQSILRYSADAHGPRMRLIKSRGLTKNDRDVVQTGDVLGRFSIEGTDGQDTVPGFELIADVDGNSGVGHIPTRLRLFLDDGVTYANRITIEKDGTIKQTSGTAEVHTNNVVAADQTIAQTFSSLLGWVWKKGNDVLAILKANGRLGLGTDTPLFGIHLVTATSPTVYVESLTNAGGQFRSKNQIGEMSFGLDSAATGDMVLRDVLNNQIAYRYRSGANQNSGHRWSIQNVDMMSLDQEGLLNVGTTKFWDTRKSRLNLSYAGGSTGGITLRNSAAIGVAINFVTGASDNGVGVPTQVGSIAVTGSATSYNTTSDKRLKKNIVDTGEVGDIIDAVRVTDHEFIAEPGKVVTSMIAQELYQVYAPAVTPGDADDVEVMDKVWGVDNSKLVPLLWREVQSIRRRLESTEQMNEELSKQITALKGAGQ